MKESVALEVLSEVMHWDDNRAREELRWLTLMSRIKYDGYRDFLAGVRFAESLADWLQQFQPSDRQAAYDFIRRRLVYIGPTEIHHLVELVYPETVRKRLAEAVASRSGIPKYRLWIEKGGITQFQQLLRRTLFLGLSDGARMDTFRRVNTGIISNEQIVPATQLDSQKWGSLLDDLRTDCDDRQARFEFIFLIDDFVGSGTTLLRRKPRGTWDGKLVKFWQNIKKIRDTHLSDHATVCVHHYIGSHEASEQLPRRRSEAALALKERWFPEHAVEFTFGTVLPSNLPVNEERCPEVLRLIRHYYDSSVETKHTEAGGTRNVQLGFGQCALPLVLEHNTPNNSIALLWAETAGTNGQHAMRPLFRRRQRHV